MAKPAPNVKSKLGPNHLSKEEKERSQKNRRKKARRRRIAFGLILLTLVCAALVGVYYAFVVIFEIKTITVVGEVGLYSQEVAIEQSGLQTGENLFLVNLKEAKSSIEVNLPYIGQADIKRKLPSTLLINVSVTKDRAYLQGQDGKYYAVNENGKVLSIISTPSEDLPVVVSGNFTAELGKTVSFEYGDEEGDKKDSASATLSKEVVEALTNIIKALENSEFEGINIIDISDIYNIKMVYRDRINITVGQANSLEKKFTGAKMAIAERESFDPEVRGELSLVDKEKIIFRPESQI